VFFDTISGDLALDPNNASFAHHSHDPMTPEMTTEHNTTFGKAAGFLADVGAFTAAQDELLESPLGLSTFDFDFDFESPYSVAGSYFSTPELDAPSLFASPETHEQELPSLFGAASDFNGATPLFGNWAPVDVPSTTSAPAVFTPSAHADILVNAAAPLTFAPEDEEKDKFTGTRNTTIPPLPLAAPTMARTYLIPASTARKRAAPELPDEVVSALEQKRRTNTLAARKSRMRKANHLKELEGKIGELEREVETWKKRCAALEAEASRLR